MKTFSFGVPPGGKQRIDTWTLDESVLSKNGTPYIDIRTIDRVTFLRHSNRSGTHTNMVLQTPLESKAFRSTQQRVDADSWLNFHLMVVEIFAFLSTASPAVSVHMRGGAARMWVRFFRSLLAPAVLLLFGTGLAIANGATVAIVVILVLSVGLFVAAVLVRPWRSDRFEIPVADALVQVRGLSPINRRSRPRHK